MTTPRLRKTHTFFVATAAALLATSLSAGTAIAAGTGDDPTPTQDTLTAREAAVKTRLESETRAGAEGRANAARSGGEIVAMGLDAPYRYLWTPSHAQQTAFWCGPATSMVIDDYFGNYVSQKTYADFMSTRESGTDFSRVDDCLRYYTRKPYYYYGGLTESGFNVHVSDSLMNHGMPLAADLRIIGSLWPNYTRDYSGHIVPIEAFDWRYGTVRLNDVFDEAAWYGGGNTYGHTTYDRALVWNGVYNHFRRALVSAP